MGLHTPGGRHRDGRRIADTIRWTALGALFLLALYVLADVVLLVFAAVLIAVLLRGAAGWVGGKLGLGPGWSLALVLLVIAAAVTGVAWWSGPRLAEESTRLWQQLEQQAGAAQQALQRTWWGRSLAGRAQEYASRAGGSIAGATMGAATTTLGALGSLLVVLATALYFAASPGLYVDGALRLLPPRWRPRGHEVLDAVGSALRSWFVGQAIDMAVIGVLSWAGLFALGVPLAPLLAGIAALCNFVPYVGAIAGAVPAVLVALGQGPDQALWVAGLFAVVQALEGNVVAPLVQARTVHLPPALTILSQTVFGALFGAMGLILATPLLAAGMVAVRMVYVEDVLEPGAAAGQRAAG